LKAELILANPMIQFFMMSGFIGFCFFLIGIIKRAEIVFSPIKGFVLGALIHVETFIENDNEITEYTLQAIIGFLSVNVIWERQTG